MLAAGYGKYGFLDLRHSIVPSLLDFDMRHAGAAPGQFCATLARAVELGWLWRHESGTYVKFTPAGAELFA